MATRNCFHDLLFHRYGKELLAFTQHRSCSEIAEDLVQKHTFNCCNSLILDQLKNPAPFCSKQPPIKAGGVGFGIGGLK
ncbi:hypothetical protein [Methyloglobulus sp.]|uniref:hypothetical protein n=1 Tax=Methyloglobulus sp. TaxID=2518622 RepID=UPI0032B8291D